uniref:Ankyrin repeat family protein n=1 Tax=Mycena chlorophos TaxID=658473 RepID=A0ABQ0LDJ7_MYCCL|nr:ankyrin repeat family protein [Mycena chlorophos]
MSIIDPGQLLLKIESEPHYEYPRAMQNISLTANHPEHGKVASLSAWRIVRARLGDRFYEILDEDSDELHQFSTALFDKYGNVLPHIVEPGHRSGSGVWGRELNRGMLLYVMMVYVQEKFRGQGIGSDKVLWQETQKRQIAFFRKNGFGRVGRTAFFGYSLNENHPSRRLPVEQDPANLTDEFSPPDRETAQQTFPVHYAIANETDSTVVAFIQAAYDKDPQSIHSPDGNGFTPIHIAAGSRNIAALRKLLEWDVDADLRNAANADGVTPLELLQNQMRSTRSFVETLLVDWQGYSAEELEVEYLLKQRTDQLVPASLQEYIVKNKYGCTCGACLAGWLSPRMRYRLECQAGYGRDMMPDNYDQFTHRQVASFDDFFDVQTPYIPRRFQPDFYLSFYKGYCDIFTAAYEFLHATNEVLSESAIQPYLSQDSMFYFNKGGRIAFAFDAMTSCARDESELGDGTHEETFADSEDWKSLPTCANDLQFQLVRVMLGLNPREQWGPYYRARARGLDEEMDEDSEEDFVF